MVDFLCWITNFHFWVLYVNDRWILFQLLLCLVISKVWQEHYYQLNILHLLIFTNMFTYNCKVLEFSTIQWKNILSNRLRMVISVVKSMFSTKISCIFHISRIPRSIIKLQKNSLESTNQNILSIVNWLYLA